MTHLIAEDLVLLLLDDRSGRFKNATFLDTGIGGALMIELALRGNIDITKGSGRWARARVWPVPAAALPTDPALTDAMAVVADRQRTPEALVPRLAKRQRAVLLERLEASGTLRRQERRLLGLWPRQRWLICDTARKAAILRRLGDVLVRGISPDERTAALISVLSALGLAHKVVDPEGVSRRELKARAKQIADGDWAAKAVRDAVAAIQAALGTVAIAASIGAAGS